MKIGLRHFLHIVDRQTAIVTIVALACTYACLRLGIMVDLPFELVGVAIVFPIVFTISGAFQRREAALAELAEFRANLIAIHLAHRDWKQDIGERSRTARTLVLDLHARVRHALRVRDESSTRAVYASFSELSRVNESLRADAGLSTSELARLNQYLRNAIANVEKLRNVAVYRTPVALRAYTQVFLNAFPVLFSPYFALISSKGWWPLGFIMASLYSLVLVGLDNIQESLEDPFDGIGEDDVQLDDAAESLWLDSPVADVKPLDEYQTLGGRVT